MQLQKERRKRSVYLNLSALGLNLFRRYDMIIKSKWLSPFRQDADF